MAMLGRAFIVALCVSSADGYAYSANCVPGVTVKGLLSTYGAVGPYATALQVMSPGLYGNLTLLAVGAGTGCLDAQNALNENTVRPDEVEAKYAMQALSPEHALQQAEIQNNYLYVFETSNFRPTSFSSVCIAGLDIAGGGGISLFAVTLQKTTPTLYGQLEYIGKSETASECTQASNMINANAVSELGNLEGLQRGNFSRTYLYVFRNKMWLPWKCVQAQCTLHAQCTLYATVSHDSNSVYTPPNAGATGRHKLAEFLLKRNATEWRNIGSRFVSFTASLACVNQHPGLPDRQFLLKESHSLFVRATSSINSQAAQACCLLPSFHLPSVMAMLGKVLLAALCVSSAVSYKFSANCVPGFIVGGVSIFSAVGHYTPILQSMLPTTYGKLKLLAVGANPDCEDAANAINENTVRLYEVADKYYLQALNQSQVSQPANIKRSYLYVFETSNYSSYHFISVCTAGSTVSSLNQTGGRVALYVAALQTLMPRLYGEFKFLGKSETADECMQASNLINSANATEQDVERDNAVVDVMWSRPE
ncbi:unnamed protein product [Polarella glacialis]|uniref:Uncharacterized protein n=1 Tax=Polarella glacialis TaxID=89957 RepID=A0A813GN12_POLGL|nr:unnamed protein product [Polarella glacialis]